MRLFRLLTCLLFVGIHLGSWAQKPDFGFVFQNNNAGSVNITPEAVVRHPGGTYFVAGYWNGGGWVDLDPGPGNFDVWRPSTNWEDAFIVQVDSVGNFIQGHVFQGHETNEILFMEVAPNGDLILAGVFRDTVDFDPGPGVFNLGVNRVSNTTSNYVDIFFQRLTPQGQLVWARSFYGRGREELRNMELDSQGNIYLSGELQDSLDLDPGPGVSKLYSADKAPFIAKLDPNGNLLWARHAPGGQYMEVLDMALDPFDNSYVLGFFEGTVDFDPGPGTVSLNHFQGRTFLQKFDSSGNLVFANQLLGDGLTSRSQINVDSSSNMYVVGEYVGQNADFDPGPGTFFMSSASTPDQYILKLDSAQNFQWAKQMVGSSEFELRDVEINGAGEQLLTGYFRGTVDLDPGIGLDTHSTLSQFQYASYLQRLNSDGDLIYAHVFGLDASNSPSPRDLRWEGGDEFIWIGETAGKHDFDPGPDSLFLESALGDPFLVSFNADTCSTLFLNFDSVANALCANPGIVTTQVSGGQSPFVFLWSDGSINPFLNFTTTGVFSLTLIDSLGCSRSRSLWLQGPPYFSDVDFQALANFNPPFPGANFWVRAKAPNFGCLPADGLLRYVLDGPVTLSSWSVVPDSMAGDTAYWNLSTVAYDSTFFETFAQYSVDTTATVGDSVHLELLITTSANDVDSTNNRFKVDIPVVNSYDPNDKQVYPAGICEENFTDLDGRPLTYTVRFQNTGTAAARNIYILDTLSSQLNFFSLRVLDQSHPMYTEVLPGNVLRFNFDDIMLPDSASDEAGSQGYVIFEIFPDSNQVQPGDSIQNNVSIYFDYNAPIKTNTTNNTLVDTLPNCFPVAIQPQEESLRIYPNPNQGAFFIESAEWGNEIQVEVYDLNGRQILNRSYPETRRIQVDLQREAGLYLIRVREANGKWTVRKVLVE